MDNFTVDDIIHTIGDIHCTSCWIHYPKPCDNEGCSGLVHAEFLDTDAYEAVTLTKKCDACGEN